MTKMEICERIKEAARAHGFTVSEKMSTVTGLPEIISEEMNFTFLARTTENTDWAARRVEEAIEASASVRKMGGSPTPEELLITADEIRRGAELIHDLQSMNLTYIETF
ncbi:hypothetical protein BHK98_02625 [Hornefia porci]|uniref:Uncharacterized protein n=1 Tax=Hornefia porci TaxID=2652292 RepID=A0A1Q9JFY2_9FIRM|nr:hypothetical protein [Hornefia porci]OLR55057.1 hypothetical protein BHK98_02625 [Hornefia porci]